MNTITIKKLDRGRLSVRFDGDIVINAFEKLHVKGVSFVVKLQNFYDYPWEIFIVTIATTAFKDDVKAAIYDAFLEYTPK